MVGAPDLNVTPAILSSEKWESEYHLVVVQLPVE